MGKAAKGRGSERARCDQHQAAMELRLLAPINGQREWDDERGDVPQRNDQESIAIRKAVMREVEACHHDGSRDAYDGNRGAQSSAEPADLAMHANIVGAHERGLQNEEEQPSSENNGVKIKDKRARRRGVDEVLVDGVAESVHYRRGD